MSGPPPSVATISAGMTQGSWDASAGRPRNVEEACRPAENVQSSRRLFRRSASLLYTHRPVGVDPRLIAPLGAKGRPSERTPSGASLCFCRMRVSFDLVGVGARLMIKLYSVSRCRDDGPGQLNHSVQLKDGVLVGEVGQIHGGGVARRSAQSLVERAADA